MVHADHDTRHAGRPLFVEIVRRLRRPGRGRDRPARDLGIPRRPGAAGRPAALAAPPRPGDDHRRRHTRADRPRGSRSSTSSPIRAGSSPQSSCRRFRRGARGGRPAGWLSPTASAGTESALPERAPVRGGRRRQPAPEVGAQVVAEPKPVRAATCSTGRSVLSSSALGDARALIEHPLGGRGPRLLSEAPGEAAGRHACPARQRRHVERLVERGTAPTPASARARCPRRPRRRSAARRTGPGPPSRWGATTVRRAIWAATAAPWSRRITCRQRSRPAATPALVST